MVATVSGVPGLAGRLNHLFANTSQPGGHGSWTNEQVSGALHEMGAGISGAYLSQLRNGKKTNPSARHLAAVAALFGVPVAYFFDAPTAEQLDEDLPVLTAVRDPAVRRVVLRAHGLSPESLTSLIGIMDQARKFEGLPKLRSERGTCTAERERERAVSR